MYNFVNSILFLYILLNQYYSFHTIRLLALQILEYLLRRAVCWLLCAHNAQLPDGEGEQGRACRQHPRQHRPGRPQRRLFNLSRLCSPRNLKVSRFLKLLQGKTHLEFVVIIRTVMSYPLIFNIMIVLVSIGHSWPPISRCINFMSAMSNPLSVQKLCFFIPGWGAHNFFATPDPDFFLVAPAPDFFPKRLRLLVFF